MDGFQLAEEIRKNSQLARTRVLMLTSAGQRGDAARCREMGMEGYLTKPVSQSELLDAVLKVAGSKPPEAEPTLVTRHLLRKEGRSLRILLAEDNSVNQLLASRVLEKHGHNVVTARNGRAAIVYKRGVRRGHRESRKGFLDTGTVPAKMRYEGNREFFTGEKQQGKGHLTGRT